MDNGLLTICADEPDEDHFQSNGRDEVDPEIDCLQRLALEARRRKAYTQAAGFLRQRNALLPISGLPSELLSMIFLDYIEDFRPSIVQGLRHLARVMWSWWQIVKSDPRLWTSIGPPLQSVDLQIRKSCTRPLQFTWPVVTGKATGAKLAETLWNHAERWTSVDVGRCAEPKLLQALCLTPLPRVTHFSIQSLEGYRGPDSRLVVSKNMVDVRSPVMIRILPSASPTSLTTLRKLNLSGRYPTKFADFKILLRHTPNLEVLEVTNFYIVDDDSSHDILLLPALRFLKICKCAGWHEDEDAFPVDQIRAPQLQSLGIEFVDQREFMDGGARTFGSLVTKTGTSHDRPEDAPLYSIIRNASRPVFWKVTLTNTQLNICLDANGKDVVSLSRSAVACNLGELVEDALSPIASLSFPITLRFDWRRPSSIHFDNLLDTTKGLLQSLTLQSTYPIAGLAMERLCMLRVSAPGFTACPPAPNLRELIFENLNGSSLDWDEASMGGEFKAMLSKRRKLFDECGIQNQDGLVISGPNGRKYM